MNNLGVSENKLKRLKAKMQELHIFEEDLREEFIQSSGKGGQNVNKVATCVYLKHIPSGISIKCQKERSQGLNRYQARCLLVQKLADHIRFLQQQERDKIEKKKRQNRKRSALAKEAMLLKKHHRSLKKENRRQIHFHKLDEL